MLWWVLDPLKAAGRRFYRYFCLVFWIGFGESVSVQVFEFVLDLGGGLVARSGWFESGGTPLLRLVVPK